MCTVHDLVCSDFEEKPLFTLVLIRPILETEEKHAEGSALYFQDSRRSGTPFWKTPKPFRRGLGVILFLSGQPWIFTLAPVVHRTLHLCTFVDVHKKDTNLCVSDLKEMFAHLSWPDIKSGIGHLFRASLFFPQYQQCL